MQQNQEEIVQLKKKKLKNCKAVLRSFCEKIGDKIKTRLDSLLTSLRISTQLIIYFIFMSLVTFLILVSTHYFCYTKILNHDYFIANTQLVLDEVLENEIKQLISLGTEEISNQFENKMSNQLFYKIYFQELINHGLQKDSFTNIDETNFNMFDPLNTPETNYTLESKEKAVLEKINQNEFSKIFYLTFPLLVESSNFQDNRIMSGYVLTYNPDKDNPGKYLEDSFSYFNYPIETLTSPTFSNFKQNNYLLDPTISNKEFVIDQTKPFTEDNWFIYQDQSFRKAYSKINSTISFINFSQLVSKKIRHSFFQIFQFYIVEKDANDPNNKDLQKETLVSVIFKMEKYSGSKNGISYNIFASRTFDNIDREDYGIFKYSDNETFVISQSNIATLGLSDILINFYNFGLQHKEGDEDLFFEKGINFDTFDIERMGDISKTFKIQKSFKENLLLFPSMLLYNMVYQFKKEKEGVSNSEFINQINEKEKIEEICKWFNFTQMNIDIRLYRSDSSFSCLSDDQLYLYKKFHGLKYSNISIFSYPQCECVTFFCLNHTTSDIDSGVFNFADSLSLPSKCKLSLDRYYSPSAQKDSQMDKYLKFYWMPLEYIPEVNLLIISVVDNELYSSIEDDFEKEIKNLVSIIMGVYCGLQVLLGALILAVFMVRFNRFTSVITDYMKKHEEFLFNIEEKGKKIPENVEQEPIGDLSFEKDFDESSLNPDVVNSGENSNLLTGTREHGSSDNSLVDELFHIFCRYYKLDPNKILTKFEKKNKNSKTKSKADIMRSKNDLFDVLCSLSENAPKFKLNISLDINFYETSKMNLHFLKGVSKSSGISKKQIKLTQGILFEMLSTEYITDYGLVMNFRFNYVDNISRKKNDSIKKALYSGNLKSFKLMTKRKDDLLAYFQQNLESDEVFTQDSLESAFNYFLINVYYKYYEQIIQESEVIG